MRIIQLRVDDKLFHMMETDKKLRGKRSWEDYIMELFFGRKEIERGYKNK